jgi:ABC-type uncharacterized transport system permease subunit
MSTVTNDSQAKAATHVVLAKAVVKSWKTPIALAIFTLISVILFAVIGRAASAVSTFRLSTSADFIQLPSLHLPTRAAGIVASIVLVLLTLLSVYLVQRHRNTSIWMVSIFALVFMVGFLTWAGANATIPLPGLLIGTVGLATPLIFGALSGVISEHVGVVNIAIEGQLLAGAFVAALVASITHQPFIGLAAAMIAGVLVSFVLAAFSIQYFVDQIIVGVVLNVLVA